MLNSILEYHLSIGQAAEIMGVSERHTKRLPAAYRKDGTAALVHENRGSRPHNVVPEGAAAVVVQLAGGRYAGANHTHLSELLREREGMLVQVDGSHHSWLEERGPRFVLLLAVGDATGAVAQALFCNSDDTRGYLLLLEGLIRQWGIPLALYSDRHAAFKYNARQVPALARVHPVRHGFAKVMRELGIQQTFALSPQAKGRVERMAATFQDRLVTEMRLAGAATIDQAKNVLRGFLLRFNVQFAVAAEHSETAYRPVSAELSLYETISLNHTRKVGRDNTANTTGEPCNCCPGWTDPAMPVSGWRSRNGPTAT